MDIDSLRKRVVGIESQKSYQQNLENGFFQKYMNGKGLELGGRGANGNETPILPDATMVDLGYPGYDGTTLPFDTESQDYLYSSHCLEHIENYQQVLQEWYRVVKIGGYVVITVPHKFLYEKKKAPTSFHNGDHKRFYTPASLLTEIEESLPANSYRVRYLSDKDEDFDYSIPPGTHSHGQYELTVVLEKIRKPDWELAE